jgi:hypothetical protein
MTRFLLLIFLAASSTAGAIVIRDDVDDSKYRVPASEFPALVDMPGEGHGVLIAPQWVITAAHTIPAHSELRQVVINGLSRDVERVVMHSGYKTLPQELIDQAMASGEAMLIVVYLAASDDIALVRLAQPVTEVAPVAIYKEKDEPGQVVKLVGKGLRVREPPGMILEAPTGRSFAEHSTRSPVLMTAGYAMYLTSQRLPCRLRAYWGTGTAAVPYSSRSKINGCWPGWAPGRSSKGTS